MVARAWRHRFATLTKPTSSSDGYHKRQRLPRAADNSAEKSPKTNISAQNQRPDPAIVATMAAASTITADRDDFLKTIGSKVATTLFPGLCSRNTTVFLCGSAPGDRASRRSLLGNALTSGPSMIKYDVVYPEELFDELLSEDLLDLENQL